MAMQGENETFDYVKASEAQDRYCEAHGMPRFAPTHLCHSCMRDIFGNIEWGEQYTTGISVERAGRELITACPHCHYSFCE